MKNKRYTTTKKTDAGKARQWSRTSVTFVMIVVVMLIVIVRLYTVQIVANEKYVDLASRQHSMEKSIIASRGEIFLKNHNDVYPIGVNREYFIAYASPRDIGDDDLESAGQAMAEALGIDVGMVMQKLAKRNDVYEILARKVTKEDKERINAKGIVGLHFMSEYYRFYPGDSLAAHVVGFVGSDGRDYVGRYGIEAYFDVELQGSDGKVVQKRDARGGWLTSTDRVISDKEDGTDLYLTIDYKVQYEVERILRDAVEKFDADGASIVVMDPRTGKILALANEPSFIPNEYNMVEDVAVFRNHVVSDEYECGSVFKPITMAMGLDAEKITPESTYIDTGSVQAAEYTIKNSEDKKYGLQTMTQVLENSINTGVIHVEKLVGNKKFKEYVERFGFGLLSGITLPAEADGNTSNLEYVNRDVEYYTASFGQGITVTPLQLASAYGALANGGYLMRPQIVEKKVYADGSEEVIAPHVMHRVISQEASDAIGTMLRNVVVNGHGKRADVPGYIIAGKTGTAQVAKSGERGYDDSQTIGTFAGYGPVNDPQFVIIVRIDNPKTVIWAESSAAPTFGAVMTYLLDHYNIAPTEPIIDT
jgi:cell division protein FtsI/penicillin-binding protein 2